MKTKRRPTFDRVSRDLYFCYRGRHYVHGTPALRILKHSVCAACKTAGE